MEQKEEDRGRRRTVVLKMRMSLVRTGAKAGRMKKYMEMRMKMQIGVRARVGKSWDSALHGSGFLLVHSYPSSVYTW